MIGIVAASMELSEQKYRE